jgi:PAS domain S-box-containing protein
VDVTEQVVARRELEQRERTASLLAAIVDSTDDAVVSKNLDGIITSWNKSAERLFGYSAKEAIGQHITLVIPPERHAEESDILARLRRGERIDHFETVRRRKDGTMLDLSLTISPVFNATGKVIGASKVARDISKRKEAENALADAARQQNALFHLADKLHRAGAADEIYTAALDAICEALQCDRASILLYDNAGIMKFVSWRGLSQEYRAAVEGHSPWKRNERDPQPVSVADVGEAELEDSLKEIILAENIRACAFIPLVSNGELIGKFMAYFPERRRLTADEIELSLTIARQLAFAIERKAAEERERQITAEAVTAQENYRKLAESLDAEVRMRTRELEKRNADVLRQSEQLRELSYRLLRVQDEERRHIARELHDSAGQTLTVLGMNLAQLVQRAARNSPQLSTEAEKIQETVQQLHRELRTASYLLHPPLLDESGLSSALAWYTEGLMERSGLDVHLDIARDFGRLPADMELVIFRVVQECLTNIHRHSGSKTASIRIVRQEASLTMNIEDEGKGISPEKLADIQAQGSGVGIRGMRERLRQFNGTMKIQSNGSGTQIVVTVPLPSAGVNSITQKSVELPAAV